MADTALAQRVVSALKKAGKTLSSAESCTGGLLAKEITDIPGASSVFHGAVVSYVNPVKHIVLGVSGADLDRYGAVSEPVSRQMAEGARMLLHTDLAVSTTGVAGPDRDDFGNEVGTVYISLAAGDKTHCFLRRFSGDRTAIREAAATFALELVLRVLTGDALPDNAL